MNGGIMKERVDVLLKWLTPVSVLVSIIFFWSSDHQSIVTLGSKLNAFETHGTPSMVAHKAEDDTRIAAINKRLDLLEQIVISVPTIHADIARIGAKIDAMQKQLDNLDQRKIP